jgi:plasmid stabilization system protein ParE
VFICVQPWFNWVVPSDQPENNKAKRPLPQELHFLNELSSIPPMERDEVPVWVRGLLQKIRENAELMRQHDLDPDRFINTLLPHIELLESAQREVDDAEEKVLHAAADEADAARAAVDALEKAIQQAAEEKRFDPRVEKWLEELEEIRKHYPKID